MTQILDLVYRGEADVGFVVNCLLEDVQALGKYKEEDFKVIGDRGLRSGSSCKHSTRLYPNWSFSIKPQMSPDESKAVVMALLSIPRLRRHLRALDIDARRHGCRCRFSAAEPSLC